MFTQSTPLSFMFNISAVIYRKRHNNWAITFFFPHIIMIVLKRGKKNIFHAPTPTDQPENEFYFYFLILLMYIIVAGLTEPKHPTQETNLFCDQGQIN